MEISVYFAFFSTFSVLVSMYFLVGACFSAYENILRSCCVSLRAFSFLWCIDTIGWVTGRTSCPLETHTVYPRVLFSITVEGKRM